MPMWFYSSTGVLNLSFIDHQESSSAASSYTFTYTFSTANPNRYLVAVIAWQAATAITPTVTIGGAVATQIAILTAITAPCVAVFAANVPLNTTQTVVVSISPGALLMQSALYDLEGVSTLNSTAVTNNTTTQSETLNVLKGGAVLAAVFATGVGVPTSSWSGITKDVDVNTGNRVFSPAHDNFATGNASLAVADTLTGASFAGGAYLVFSP
jgi:hypothetical protein